GTQTFHVGEASVAVPGLVAGLAEAHRRFGSLPWASLVEPAIALAEGGVERDAPRDFLHRILSGILLRTEEGARVYGDPSRVVTKEIVPTLERIRDAGASAVADLLPELADDLAAYRVLECTPLRARVLEHELLTTPTPSKGGSIVLESSRRSRRSNSGRSTVKHPRSARRTGARPRGGSPGRPISPSSTGRALPPRSRRRSVPGLVCSAAERS